jgi:hypothetical protein
MGDDKDGDASPNSFAPVASAGRTSSLGFRESRSPGHSLEAQFHPMNDALDPALTEMVNEAMRV